MRGGARQGSGRKTGSTNDRVKLGISVSKKNADWLRAQKAVGFNMSTLIDRELDKLRANESWKPAPCDTIGKPC